MILRGFIGFANGGFKFFELGWFNRFAIGGFASRGLDGLDCFGTFFHNKLQRFQRRISYGCFGWIIYQEM